MDDVGARAAWDLAEAIRGLGKAAGGPGTGYATCVRVDADGTAWVRLLGAESETPVNGRRLVDLAAGDLVTVSIEGGTLSVTGNATAPATSAAHVDEVVAPVSEMAQSAVRDAGLAAAAAGSAQESADAASAAATSALNSLSTVEDVVDTLTWITEHGTMAKTADTAVDPSKVYFVRDDDGDYTVGGNRYSIVQEPVASALSSYYELTIDKSVENYIATHLSVTNEGLWLTPTESGGYRVLVATGGAGKTYPTAGTYIIDGSGKTVAQFTGKGISFADDRAFYIGDESAYIFFDGNGHINIGGTVLMGGSKTLSEVLAELGQASEDAARARDVCTISLTSTNGTVFKQNLGVSTSIVATLFTGDGLRIADAQALRSRYGAGAFLQWRWKDSGTGDFVTISSADPRLSAGGFVLTVSPQDVSTQAVIDCELVY